MREREGYRERERGIYCGRLAAWLLGCLPFASGYPCRFFQSHLMLQSALLSEPSATLHCLFQLLAVCKSYAPWPRPPTQPASLLHAPFCCIYIYVYEADTPLISRKYLLNQLRKIFQIIFLIFPLCRERFMAYFFYLFNCSQ